MAKDSKQEENKIPTDGNFPRSYPGGGCHRYSPHLHPRIRRSCSLGRGSTLAGGRSPLQRATPDLAGLPRHLRRRRYQRPSAQSQRRSPLAHPLCESSSRCLIHRCRRRKSLVLVVGDDTYRLDQPKGTTARAIKNKEARQKM